MATKPQQSKTLDELILGLSLQECDRLLEVSGANDFNEIFDDLQTSGLTRKTMPILGALIQAQDPSNTEPTMGDCLTFLQSFEDEDGESPKE